uniref:LysR family transcriptional regulator n=1 Tax=Brotaphodocola sp. TaxID=3073577 RepID=UPI003D7DB1AD
MNTFQLACFLSVAKTLNFSRTAQELNISQPAVSHQINMLEKELNVKLFSRTSKSVTLTQEGLQFLPDADDMIHIAASAKERLASREQTVSFAIGCHNYAELEMVPGILRDLKKEYPLLRPMIHMVPFENLGNQLENGRIQIMSGMRDSYHNPFFCYKEI